MGGGGTSGYHEDYHNYDDDVMVMLIMIDISCISDWDLSLHSLSSDQPCFFLF